MATEMWDGNSKVMIGIAIGAAVAIGIVFSRMNRKKTPWDAARDITKRVSDKSSDLAAVTRDMVDHVRTIYDEGCKVVEEAGELWSHGRRLVGY
jgi:hypothetical protein